jgi:hypothetical protein
MNATIDMGRIPVRVTCVDERGPVIVCGRIHALRELAHELLRTLEARRGSVLQRRREVDPIVIWARFARHLYVRHRVVPATCTCTKDAP